MKRFKPSSPDQDDDFVAEETLKFLSLTPEEGESLISFHSRLAQQAVVCGFQCGDCRGSYKQRLIRDRLLQVLEKDLRSNVLKRFPNPTVDDILTVHREENDFQNNPGWPMILNYLELVELETFAQSHPRLRKIVYSYLEEGGQLVLKGRSLYRYMDTPEIFSKYGQRTTAMELVKIDAEKVFPHFPNVTDLTLRRVNIDVRDRNTLPRSLTKLRLFGTPSIDHILDKSKQSLTHLHITATEKSPNEIIRLPTFSKLQSLTLGNLLLKEHPFSPVLEELHLKLLKNPLDWTSQHGIPITSLTLDRWDRDQETKRYELVKSLPFLKHLRILEATRSEFKDKIMGLDFESVEMYFVDSPEEQDLIVDMLDDDCLHIIFDSLEADDLARLCQVHSRIRKVITGRRKKSFEIGYEFVKQYPPKENRAFYHWLGEIVNKLSFYIADEDSFYQVIRHFGRLDELRLYYTDFKDL